MINLQNKCVEDQRSAFIPSFLSSSSSSPAPYLIKGEPEAIVQQFKYLGTVPDAKRTFDANTDREASVDSVIKLITTTVINGDK